MGRYMQIREVTARYRVIQRDTGRYREIYVSAESVAGGSHGECSVDPKEYGLGESLGNANALGDGSFRERFPWERSLSLQAIPGGGIILITSQQGESSHIALDLDASERSDLLRITYSWDAPARWGRLAIERPERGSVSSILAPRPRPLWLDDIKTMTLSHKLIHLDSDVEFLIECVCLTRSSTYEVPLEFDDNACAHGSDGAAPPVNC